MSFTDTGHFSDPFGGGGGVAGANPGASGGVLGGPGFGGGESKLTGTNAPGTISPFEQQTVGRAANLSGEAMQNRYAQLGLAATGATPGHTSQKTGLHVPGTPGSAPGGLGGGPLPTAEAMDLGTGFPGGLPSLGGGITGEAEATLGEIQNAQLQQSGGSGGGGKGGGGGGGKGGGMGSMLPLLMGGK
jgi:hypothetical protein